MQVFFCWGNHKCDCFVPAPFHSARAGLSKVELSLAGVCSSSMDQLDPKLELVSTPKTEPRSPNIKPVYENLFTWILMPYLCEPVCFWPAVCHFSTVWGPNSRWSQWKLNMNWWHCNCILETTEQNKSGSVWHFNSKGCACSFLIARRSESSQMLTCQVQQEICKNIRPVSFWL